MQDFKKFIKNYIYRRCSFLIAAYQAVNRQCVFKIQMLKSLNDCCPLCVEHTCP
jgi:hypothetical protein